MKKILRYILTPVLTGVIYLSVTSWNNGITNKSVSGCGGTGCHAAGVTATMISITGLPATYTPGNSYPLTLNVSNANYTNTADKAGFDMTVTAGLITGAATNTMIMSGTEYHHTTGKVLASGATSWTFTWTAPLTGTSTTFNVAGNVTNGNFNQSGDAANLFTTTVNAAAVTLPTVATGAATNITANSATLNGSVNPNGILPGFGMSFEYGLTTAYGTNPVGTPATATGSTAVNTTTALTGLLPNTTYHYRTKATSPSLVNTFGPDMTFKTLINTSVANFDKLGVKVYPNPNNTGVLQLENLSLKNPSFSVTSIDGKLTQLTGNMNGANKYTLNINNLSMGVYVLQIASEGQVYNTKFTKQ